LLQQIFASDSTKNALVDRYMREAATRPSRNQNPAQVGPVHRQLDDRSWAICALLPTMVLNADRSWAGQLLETTDPSSGLRNTDFSQPGSYQVYYNEKKSQLWTRLENDLTRFAQLQTDIKRLLMDFFRKEDEGDAEYVWSDWVKTADGVEMQSPSLKCSLKL